MECKCKKKKIPCHVQVWYQHSISRKFGHSQRHRGLKIGQKVLTRKLCKASRSQIPQNLKCLAHLQSFQTCKMEFVLKISIGKKLSCALTYNFNTFEGISNFSSQYVSALLVVGTCLISLNTNHGINILLIRCSFDYLYAAMVLQKAHLRDKA